MATLALALSLGLGQSVFANVVGALESAANQSRNRDQYALGADDMVLTGWALSADEAEAIDRIRVEIDSLPAGEGVLGIERPDLFPIYGQKSQYAGYRSVVPLNGLSIGTHSFRVIAEHSNGETLLGQSSFTVCPQAPNIDLAVISELGPLGEGGEIYIGCTVDAVLRQDAAAGYISEGRIAYRIPPNAFSDQGGEPWTTGGGGSSLLAADENSITSIQSVSLLVTQLGEYELVGEGATGFTESRRPLGSLGSVSSSGLTHFTVSKATPKGTFSLTEKQVGAGSYILTAEDLCAAFFNPYSEDCPQPSGVISYSISPASPNGLGGAAIDVGYTFTPGRTYKLRATVAGDSLYHSFFVDADLVISKASQTITFSPPASTTIGEPITLSASASSGLPVEFRLLSGPARISGQTITPTGIGPVSIQVSQGGDQVWAPAQSVIQNITVLPGSASMTGVLSYPNTTAGTTIIPSSTPAVTNGSIVYSTSDTQIAFVDAGTGIVTALKAGSFRVTASLTPSANYSGSSAISSNLVTVSLASQSAVSVTPVTAHATPGLTLSFSASGGSGVGDFVWGGLEAAEGIGTTRSITFTDPGIFTVSVYRKASGIYEDSSPATATVTVSTPTSFSIAAEQVYDGDPKSAPIIASPSDAVFEIGGQSIATEAGTYTATAKSLWPFSGQNNNLIWTIRRAEQTAPVITASAVSVAPGVPITLTASGGTGSGAYAWGGSAGAIGKGASTSVTLPSEGEFSVTLIREGDANHNASPIATLMLYGAGAVSFSSGTDYTYDGSMKTVRVVSSVSNATYSLSGQTSAKDAGTYEAIATATGRFTGSSVISWTILKASQQAVQIIADAELIQPGVPVHLTAKGGDGSGSYRWTIEGETSSSGVSRDASFAVPGTYTVSVFRDADTNYEASVAASKQIRVASPTTFTLDGPFTYDGTTKHVSVYCNPSGATYTTSGTLEATNAGEYEVFASATGLFQGTSGAMKWVIAKAPQPALVIQGGSIVVKKGASKTFSVSGGAGSGPIVWGGTSGAQGNAFTTTVQFNEIGEFTVSASKQSDTNYLSVDALPITVTVEEDVTFEVANSYVYDGTLHEVEIRTNPSNAKFTVGGTTSALNAGTYHVSVTGIDGFTGSDAAMPWTIARAPQPAVALNAEALTTRPGTPLTFTAGGGLSIGAFHWSTSSGLTGIGSSQTFAFPEPGQYQVSVYRDGDSNYLQSPTNTVTILVAAEASFSCDGTFVYDGDEKSVVIQAFPEDATYAVSGTTSATNAGTYTVSITGTGAYAGQQCTLNWAIQQAEQAPIVASPASQTVYIGQSASFSVSGGTGDGPFVWSGIIGGEALGNTVTLPCDQLGTTSVSVYRAGDRNYLGSSPQRLSVRVVKAPQAAISLNPSAGATVETTTNTPLHIAASGGSGSGEYLWSGAANGYGVAQTVTFPLPGIYQISVLKLGDAKYIDSQISTLNISVSTPAVSIPSDNTGTNAQARQTTVAQRMRSVMRVTPDGHHEVVILQYRGREDGPVVNADQTVSSDFIDTSLGVNGDNPFDPASTPGWGAIGKGQWPY